MATVRAIDLALDFARVPALAKQIEIVNLPADVDQVISIAAELPEACTAATEATGQPTSHLVEACRFYVQQVLLRPNASSYRILGVNPGASRSDARRNMMLLLMWLHPDRNEGMEAIYANRVIKAWKDLTKDHAFSELASRASKASKENRSPQFKIAQRVRWPLIAASVGAGKVTYIHPTWLSKRVLTIFGGALLLFLVWSAQFWLSVEK